MQHPSVVRPIFLDTVAQFLGLLADPVLDPAWDEPSVLPRMSVGALVGHLSRGTVQVEAFLDAKVPGDEPIDAPRYYAPFTDTGLDVERNRAVRDRGSERAALGRPAILAEGLDVLARLRDRLPAEPDDRRVEARGSTGMRGRVLLLDEYLKVRLVEHALHQDDLVRSVPGLGPASLPDAASDIAIRVLVEAAVLRHGPAAVLRALARREADTVDALRVL